jgi:hypothetical protein
LHCLSAPVGALLPSLLLIASHPPRERVPALHVAASFMWNGATTVAP